MTNRSPAWAAEYSTPLTALGDESGFVAVGSSAGMTPDLVGDLRPTTDVDERVVLVPADADEEPLIILPVNQNILGYRLPDDVAPDLERPVGIVRS